MTLMVEFESTLELLAQQLPPQGGYWLGMFFLAGLIGGLAVTFIITGYYHGGRRDSNSSTSGVPLICRTALQIPSKDRIPKEKPVFLSLSR